MTEARGLLLRASEIREKSRTASHPWNDKSEIHGFMHHFEEEWIYVLSGRGTAEIDGQEYEVGPGDFMGFPTPSVAHHLRNSSGEDLVYLMGGENLDHEIADFPKLGRRMVRHPGGADVYDLADGEPYDPSSPRKGRIG